MPKIFNSQAILYAVLFFIFFVFYTCIGDSGTSVCNLKSENLENPVGIAEKKPRLSWKLKSKQNGVKQKAFHILAASDKSLLNEKNADLWNTGRVESDQSVLVKYKGKELSSGSLVYWKVKVWDNNDEESGWSSEGKFSIGLLNENDWDAKYIGFPSDSEYSECPLLTQTFEVKDKKKGYFLHVNSLGYHEVYLNGKKVSDNVLSPAVSQMNKRSLVVTYDVSRLVNKGRNDLVIWIGQGWYHNGNFDLESKYDIPVVRAQLNYVESGKTGKIISTGTDWKGRLSAYQGIGTWRPHRFGGEILDGSKLDADFHSVTLENLQWQAVTEINVPQHLVTPQLTEPNIIRNSLEAVSVEKVSDSTWLVDMGKSVTGWTEILFPELDKGQTITIGYCDHLTPEGKYVDNKQEDKYIAKGEGVEKFKNKFNYHGFRYLQISNLKDEPKKENIKAHLIQTGFSDASTFECSDKDMNDIHDMIKYTLKCLSLGGYLVDCPQMERLGYGGDGNASTVTAQTMFDLSPLYDNWISAWNDCVREEGGLPHTAPNPYSAGGGPYWCAFVIAAPWQTYINYGDISQIDRYYPLMQQWLSYVAKYSLDGLLKRWPDTDYRSWYLGDWACPVGTDPTLESSIDLVNNCVVSECFDTMSKIAGVLGKKDDVEKYRRQKSEIDGIIQKTFFNNEGNIYSTGSQIDMAYPMLSGVTPDSLLKSVTGQMKKNTEQNSDGHVACGLVGIPVLTAWAIENNESDFIYSMLKKRTYPGYLYMIDNGATTTWEHWNGDRSRIHNCYNGIGSWFYRAIGGIRPDEKNPGYKHFFIEPQIPSGITWAKSTKETPYGKIAVSWSLENQEIKLSITVPAGSTADLIIPENIETYVLNERSVAKSSDSIALESGKHNIKYAFNN
ncbi:MAG: glycoside hydrolase family 78 protein [Dysgonamonadaceae bacterium]|nr:glycoside hydrolase family 78 protein [Dysgonamonadaceae bacterium]